MTTAVSHGSSSEVSKRTGICVRSDLDRLLALDADHAAARAGHADVGDVGGAARQHARVGGRHVRVGADDRRHAAVEVPAHRDLLARRLGVHVDEHVVDAARSACSAASTSGSAGRAGLHEEVAATGSRRRARTPSRSTTHVPWPGWLRRKLAGRRIRGCSSR